MSWCRSCDKVKHWQVYYSYTHMHTPTTYTHTTRYIQNTYMLTSFHCNVTITIGTLGKADLSWYKVISQK